MSVQIIFVGDVMQDILISFKDQIAYGSDTQSQIKMQGGGSATNTACWAATQKVLVGLVARIGDDQTGKLIRDGLIHPNLSLNLVETPNSRSGSCGILIDAEGERTMFPDPGANIFLSASDVPNHWFETAEIIHISAYSLLRTNTKKTIQEIIEKAKQHNIKTSIDVASSQPLIDNDGFNSIAQLAPFDFLFANKDEAEVLGDTSKIKSLCHNLILKKGSKESIWLSPDREIIDIPANMVVVDSIGAGDAFAAGFLTSLVKKEPAATILKNANNLGSQAVKISGARPF